MLPSARISHLRVLLVAGLVAATSLIVSSKAECQVAAAPVFSASTVGGTTTLTISDATPSVSIYYATGGRVPTINSILYTGPLTVSLPITIAAVAVAPGSSVSPVASTTYSTVLGTTTLTSSQNPVVLGQPVTFTAAVSPASGTTLPAGSLQFSVNGVALGSPMQLGSDGVATYTSSELPEAYLSITATYVPSSGAPITSSMSPALIQAVYNSQRQSNNVYFDSAVKPLGSGFSRPYGLTVDASSDVFIADTGNHVVKEMLAANDYTVVTTLATNPSKRFNSPTSVALDSSNNLFVADGANNAVYELLASDGYFSTKVIGSGFSWPYGVTVDSNNDLFVADTGNQAVKWLTESSGYTSNTTIGSEFQYPWGIAIDSSHNLFVTDIGKHTVNLLTTADGYTSVRPLGSNGFFDNPYGVAVDSYDNLFVSDLGYGAVRQIALIDGWTTISTPVYGLDVPIGTAVDHNGNIFVADTNNNLVKEVSQGRGVFGQVKLGNSSTYAISMTFFFETPTTLGSTAIVGLDGSATTDFYDALTGSCMPNTPYAGVSTCTVDVLFTPKQSGVRVASVELLDNSGIVLASGIVQGTGFAQ